MNMGDDELKEPLDVDIGEDGSQASNGNEDIVIEQVAEAPAKSDIEDGLEALKKQLEDEKRAKADSDRRASEAQQREAMARQQALEASNRAQDSDLSLLNNSIAQRQQAADYLESQYEAALQAGDTRAAAQIQRKLARNEAELLQIEQGKAALETAPRQREVPQQQPQRYADPVDAFASQLSPRSADWVRSHPEYARDPRKNQEMIAAHQLAVARGHEADTDAYFQAVESVLGLNQQQETPRAAPERRQAPPPTAPSSRQGGTPGSSSPNRVRLTSEEVEMAEILGQTPEEYARHKVALQKSGRLNS